MDTAIPLATQLAEALGEGFVVERPLGAGGFGAVFLVTEQRLGRALAVKVLAPDLLASRGAGERFEREAATVAQLAHPHIVPLHFVGGRGDFRFLAMGYVDGGTAADRLAASGPLPPAMVRRILRDVADALAHAHRRGLVHRDVKPANVLLDRESGRALLSDFGLARTAASGLTASGIVIGTPAYMAPEMLLDQPATARSDLYALGLLGYELLTGRLPFDGPNAGAAMLLRISQPARPLRDARPDVPEALATLVMHCLAREPEDRPPSAEAVVEALEAVSVEVMQATPARGARRPSARVAGAAVLAGLGVAWLAWRALSPRGVRGNGPSQPGAAARRLPAEVSAGWWRMPAGRVRLGSDADRSRPPRLSARPAHDTVLSAFRLAPAPASVGDLARFAAERGVDLGDAVAGDAVAPARGVRWGEARSFCAWHVAGGRLPTEAEWEAAAQVHGDAMLGRGWEWTASPVRAYAGGPAIPRQGTGHRVIRGGAAGTPQELLTPSLRGYADPDAPRRDLAQTGVRCAVDEGAAAAAQK